MIQGYELCQYTERFALPTRALIESTVQEKDWSEPSSFLSALLPCFFRD